MAFQVGVQRRSTGAETTKRSLFYLILILYSAITAIPFLWSILTSFKPLPETERAIPTGIPLHWTLAAWTGQYGVFSSASFPRWFLNSVIVASLVCLGNLFFDSLAGYAFARL